MKEVHCIVFDQELWSKIDVLKGTLSRSEFLQDYLVMTLKVDIPEQMSLDEWFPKEDEEVE